VKLYQQKDCALIFQFPSNVVLVVIRKTFLFSIFKLCCEDPSACNIS